MYVYSQCIYLYTHHTRAYILIHSVYIYNYNISVHVPTQSRTYARNTGACSPVQLCTHTLNSRGSATQALSSCLVPDPHIPIFLLDPWTLQILSAGPRSKSSLTRNLTRSPIRILPRRWTPRCPGGAAQAQSLEEHLLQKGNISFSSAQGVPPTKWRGYSLRLGRISFSSGSTSIRLESTSLSPWSPGNISLRLGSTSLSSVSTWL